MIFARNLQFMVAGKPNSKGIGLYDTVIIFAVPAFCELVSLTGTFVFAVGLVNFPMRW